MQLSSALPSRKTAMRKLRQQEKMLQSRNLTLSIRFLKILKKQCSACFSRKLKKSNSVKQKSDRCLQSVKPQESPAATLLRAKLSAVKQLLLSETEKKSLKAQLTSSRDSKTTLKRLQQVLNAVFPSQNSMTFKKAI